jgi:5-methylcytosine-specific restriction endonuclease McrA
MRLFGRIKTKSLLRSFSFLSKRCLACGRLSKDVILNVDHVPPRRLYPELALAIENLQVLCAQCNQGKGNKDATDRRQ